MPDLDLTKTLIGLAGSGAAVAIAKLFIDYLSKRDALQVQASPSTSNGEKVADRAALRDAQRQLDELKAGSQPVEFWVRKYDESAVRANQPVLLKLDQLLESQQRIRVRLKMEDDEH